MRAMRTPIASYVPGHSPVHRAPLWLRAGLPLVVSVLAVALPGPVPALALLGGAVAWWGLSGVGAVRAARDLRAPGAVLLLLFAYHWGRSGWQGAGLAQAVAVCAGLGAAVLTCLVLTWTTRPADLLEGVVRLARRVPGLDGAARRFALAVSLMLTAVPTLQRIWWETREAALARGRGRDVRAQVSPVVVRTVGHALQLGEALAARGLDGREPDDRT